MDEKDRKAMNERVKLRGQVDKAKRELVAAVRARDEWFRKFEERGQAIEIWRARFEQLQACFDSVCSSLGKGTGT